MNQFETNFIPYSNIDIFDFDLAENLKARSQNFPGMVWKLAAKKLKNAKVITHLVKHVDAES